MARVLVIDDDPVIRKITSSVLGRLGYEVSLAADGTEGLTLVQTDEPDIVITDVMMPGIDGYEVTRRLRRNPKYARIPILVLTSRSELEEKLHAFEAGADDYMSKPFEPAELAARLSKLLHWREVLLASADHGDQDRDGLLIAVHSLRGGIGCSSLATNLALGLHGLWESPVLLMDMVMTAGQIALMLDASLRRTWADLTRFETGELENDLVNTVIATHDSGLDYIAAPTHPEEAELLNADLISKTIALLRPRYEYIVMDIAHDFGTSSLPALDAADMILLLLAPEMSSVRAAAAALETYEKLGYPKDKVRVVLNWTFQHHGLAGKSIEQALHFPISLVLPFAPDRFITAINHGRPLLYSRPEDPVSALLEDFAYRLSKDEHRALPPAVPSAAWQRVNQRMNAARSGKRR